MRKNFGMELENCVAPEIVSPVHPLGLPIRDLSKL